MNSLAGTHCTVWCIPAELLFRPSSWGNLFAKSAKGCPVLCLYRLSKTRSFSLTIKVGFKGNDFCSFGELRAHAWQLDSEWAAFSAGHREVIMDIVMLENGVVDNLRILVPLRKAVLLHGFYEESSSSWYFFGDSSPAASGKCMYSQLLRLHLGCLKQGLYGCFFPTRRDGST